MRTKEGTNRFYGIKNVPLGVSKRPDYRLHSLYWRAICGIDQPTLKEDCVLPPTLPPPLRPIGFRKEERCGFGSFAGRSEMGREGFEPSTLGLRVPCSTN